MTLDPAMKRVIDAKLAAGQAPQWERPIEEVRAEFRARWAPEVTGAPIEVKRVEDREIATEGGALRLRVIAPQLDDEGAGPLVQLHGGGWVKGGLDESEPFCRRLATATGRVVVAVGYRLAPEHRFPAAHDDCLAATAWVAGHAAELGAADAPPVLCGESAGGHLAVVTALRARAAGGPAIARLVLLQPVIDPGLGHTSIDMAETECLVGRRDLAWYYREYFDGAGLDEPMVSPLAASSLAGLPPTLVVAAEYDSLRDEAEAFAARLQADGVAAEYRCYPGMIHGFQQMAGLTPAAAESIAEIAGFVAGA